MANLKRYTMVVRRDEFGAAHPALKVRQQGEVVKFEDIKEFLPSASYNGASPKLPPYNKESFIKYLGDNNMGFADTSLSCAKHYHEFLRRQLQA